MSFKIPEAPKGIIGSLLFAWGVLDVIGRLQTAANILPRINLNVAIGLIVVGPLLVWWSVRSEQNRNKALYEAEIAKRKQTPAIWTPDSNWRANGMPPEIQLPSTNWFWFKAMLSAGLCAALFAIGVAVLRPTPKVSRKLAASTDNASPAKDSKSTTSADPINRTTDIAHKAPVKPELIIPNIPSINPMDVLRAMEIIKASIRSQMYVTQGAPVSALVSVTSPPSSKKASDDIFTILSIVCQLAASPPVAHEQCSVTDNDPYGDSKVNAEFPRVEDPIKDGIVVHSKSYGMAEGIRSALASWFENVKRSGTMPDFIERYNANNVSAFAWVEFGETVTRKTSVDSGIK